MYELKTANLIQAALMTAAIISAPDDVDNYETLGYYIGLIFQIQDDILEHVSSPEVTGKSKLDSLRNKPTYVSLLGLNAAQDVLADYIKTLNELIVSLKIQDTPLHHQIQQLLTRKK